MSSLQRLRDTFGARLAWLNGIAGNNRILFAMRPGAPSRGERRLLRLARRLNGGAGAGWGWSNRWLARGLVAWLAHRSP